MRVSRSCGRQYTHRSIKKKSEYAFVSCMDKCRCEPLMIWFSRAMHHIRHLLDLISQFPRVNPGTANTADDVDIPQLFRQIRSRYKALCSTLGVKPSMRAADGAPTQDLDEQAPNGAIASPATASQARSVWKIEDRRVDRSAQGLDF